MSRDPLFDLVGQTPRERALLEAVWNAIKLISPDDVARRYGKREAEMQVKQLREEKVLPFLAMYDAAQAFKAPDRA